MAKKPSDAFARARGAENSDFNNGANPAIQDLLEEFNRPAGPRKTQIKAILGSEFSSLVDSNWTNKPKQTSKFWNSTKTVAGTGISKKQQIINLLTAMSQLNFNDNNGKRPSGWGIGASSSKT